MPSFRPSSFAQRLGGLARALTARHKAKAGQAVDTVLVNSDSHSSDLSLVSAESNAAAADPLASGDGWRAGLAGWGQTEAAGAEAKGRRKAGKKDKKNNNNKKATQITQNERKIIIRFGPAVALDSGSHTPSTAPSSPAKSCLKRSPSTDTTSSTVSSLLPRPARLSPDSSAASLLAFVDPLTPGRRDASAPAFPSGSSKSHAAAAAAARAQRGVAELRALLIETHGAAWLGLDPVTLLPLERARPTGPQSVYGLGPYRLARASTESLVDPVMHAKAKKIPVERPYGWF